MRLDIHIDGGSRGNPGPAAAAVVASDLDSGRVIHEAGYFLGNATNNEAEYRGLLYAIKLAIHLRADEVQFTSDSELMVRQITGAYRVKSAELRTLYEEAQALLLKLDSWRITHVKREENQRADQLVNMALDAKRNVEVTSDSSVPGPKIASGGNGSPHAAASPAWVKVRLASDPGSACPAPADDQWINLGPETPNGLCVYAAKAVLDRVLADPKTGPASATGRVTCPRCRAKIEIEPAD